MPPARQGGAIEIERLDFEELVVPMLVDAELCEDEGSAKAKFAALWVQLTKGETDGVTARPELVSAEPKLLSGAGTLSLKDQAAAFQERAEASSVVGMTSGPTNVNAEIVVVAPSAETQRSESKDIAKQRARRAASAAKAAEEAEALVAELHLARQSAAHARIARESEAPLGSIELGPFSVANPGGGDNLVEEAELVLVPGRRFGLIGNNGSGKSTLLKNLAARRLGCLPAQLNVGYVSQAAADLAVNGSSTAEMVLAADTERQLLVARLHQASSQGGQHEHTKGEPEPESELQGDCSELDLAVAAERLQVIDGHGPPAEAKVARLLDCLGFSPEMQRQPMRELSGGWRVRAALAAALFARPDLLLLDEPTNHLSLQAVLWLQAELTTNPKWRERIVVVVSHDRDFLDAVCTDTWHLSRVGRSIKAARGGYSTWHQRRVAKAKSVRSAYERRQLKIDHLDEFTKRQGKYYTHHQVHTQMKMKEQQIAKLEREGAEEYEEAAAQGLHDDDELPLMLTGGGVLSQPPLQLQEVGFSYDTTSTSTSQEPTLLFSDVSLRVEGRARVVLLGENGTGKSTLLKLLEGTIDPTVGQVHRSTGMRVAIIDQHQAVQFDEHEENTGCDTAFSFLKKNCPGDGSAKHDLSLRKTLNACGVSTAQCDAPIRALSGGQRVRVAVASVGLSKPHVLLLDEPTNNLDVSSIEALVQVRQDTMLYK